VLALQAQML
jgi:hypothetical protein